ncbi:Hypothetical protein I595_2545 [Croceitalea dokdonensis DOKDO 023]|uniref:DUF4914 domain-containing protein n=1 Tax=Croceitalea dokdonensis DOKDO 023 TaxID=1300341 RepID=A0A0P7AY58_9FLAO|nr:DUF4914 family protein [Croceitalea dokdonensis]KPM31280.1 Hypothetical protein I595_2545 [Croceitalea dokdonensis DOKDO 023]
MEQIKKKLPVGNNVELQELLAVAPSVTVAKNVEELVDLAVGGKGKDAHQVRFNLPDGRNYLEADVLRAKNGIVANYPEVYMRRRDPDCMVIADNLPTDKTRFKDRFGKEFDGLRKETFDWLKTQDLAMFFFDAGKPGMGYSAVAVVPANCGFFGLGLALLQGILDPDDLADDFVPEAVIYAAPPFRHTHFQGKQVVVHNRLPGQYELFSYNLYPGPSAKKGVYGMLIGKGEEEGWVTAHCSAVRVITPYDNVVTVMHEGASGGGKSEMLQHPHRQSDGSILLGKNILTNEKRTLEIPRTCDLQPVTDDMALCHPNLQKDAKKLWLEDAEDAWFVRVDHIKDYGTDPMLEKVTAQPEKPLLFLNINGVAGGHAMIWDHIEDKPGVACPNPRVVVPRDAFPGVYSEPVRVDIRSIGLRTPPCTKQNPDYGIVGMMHMLPPALAWLWRLVAPRGYANPSIINTKGISSEGVGSYWPFATGKKVKQANLLLEQIRATPDVKYVLTPNQHIGAWKTSFMPQWVSREFLARRGNAKFTEEQLSESRCSLLGYALNSMKVEGLQIPKWLLKVEHQEEVGKKAYDKGARILHDFFVTTLAQFQDNNLDPLGQRIIECCLDNGSVADYEKIYKG